jgi:hypothetical protein
MKGGLPVFVKNLSTRNDIAAIVREFALSNLSAKPDKAPREFECRLWARNLHHLKFQGPGCHYGGVIFWRGVVGGPPNSFQSPDLIFPGIEHRSPPEQGQPCWVPRLRRACNGKGPPQRPQSVKQKFLTAWTRFRSPRLPEVVRVCTSNSCSSAPTPATASIGCTDPAQV